MQYLSHFTLPTRMNEDDFVLNFPPQLEMQCYGHNNVYPFGLFPQKQLESYLRLKREAERRQKRREQMRRR